jgi:osmoprotectant transport system permease protein
MMNQLIELLHQLPTRLGGHMLLSLTALSIGLAISVPLGIVASRRARLAELTLGFAGVVQTIPSLALLALMVPLLGEIGFVPAFVALTLYSILPILANTILGIKGVDPALTEAARGLGMSERQMLFRVQLPLAAPVIIGGIRTATVLVVGTATLATPVGETTLGNYIFQGLETRSHFGTVFGCVLAALLAIVMDQLVRLLEVAARRRSLPLAWGGAAGLVLVLAGGLYEPIAKLFSHRVDAVVVGSGPFTEQHILSEVLALQLRAAGFDVEQHKGMGETIQFEALCRGKIDCYVDYSGSIWALEMKRTEVADPKTTIDEATRFLRERFGVVCLGSLGFEDAYAFAMRRSEARRYGIRTVGDLAGRRRKWKVGSDHQFFGRPEWVQVRDSYGLKDVETVAMDPTLMYGAVAEGAVDVIAAYTSDGRIKAYDLVLLEDPKRAFPPYDAILLVSPEAARKPGFLDALRPLVGAISLEAMQEANRRVDVEEQSPEQAGKELFEKIERGK